MRCIPRRLCAPCSAFAGVSPCCKEPPRQQLSNKSRLSWEGWERCYPRLSPVPCTRKPNPHPSQVREPPTQNQGPSFLAALWFWLEKWHFMLFPMFHILACISIRITIYLWELWTQPVFLWCSNGQDFQRASPDLCFRLHLRHQQISIQAGSLLEIVCTKFSLSNYFYMKCIFAA